jgi:hypothetical protein
MGRKKNSSVAVSLGIGLKVYKSVRDHCLPSPAIVQVSPVKFTFQSLLAQPLRVGSELTERRTASAPHKDTENQEHPAAGTGG